MASIDGAECPHGINVFDPRGCVACTASVMRMRPKPVTAANGHVPHPEVIRKKFEPTESD